MEGRVEVKPKICIVRAPGTNCDAEAVAVLEHLGAQVAVVHVNKLIQSRNLKDYDALLFPGGFSYGDNIRSGAIMGKKFVAALGRDLNNFVDEGKPVLGICNGMQILVETGLVPGNVEAAMATNDSARFECRWIRLKVEKNKSLFSKGLPKILLMPVAHGEGRVSFQPGREEEIASSLESNGQVVFKYCDENGKLANGVYPTNPNGAVADIAGLCNEKGNVMALMPHPERASFPWQYPDWTRRSDNDCAPIRVFENLVSACK